LKKVKFSFSLFLSRSILFRKNLQKKAYQNKFLQILFLECLV